MIQTNQQSLSESEIGTLKEWLTSAGADLFLKVIRSEMAYVQSEAASHYINAERKFIEEDKQKMVGKARFLTVAADDLEFVLEKFAEMRNEDKPYEFKTITLTP